MNHEDLVAHVDRQKDITKRARETAPRVLSVLDVGMILSDRARARKRFISAMVKLNDKLFTESLRNGHSLKEAKLGG